MTALRAALHATSLALVPYTCCGNHVRTSHRKLLLLLLLPCVRCTLSTYHVDLSAAVDGEAQEHALQDDHADLAKGVERHGGQPARHQLGAELVVVRVEGALPAHRHDDGCGEVAQQARGSLVQALLLLLLGVLLCLLAGRWEADGDLGRKVACHVQGAPTALLHLLPTTFTCQAFKDFEGPLCNTKAVTVLNGTWS